MKKINIAIVSSSLGCNGISSVIMNYCRNINLNKFEITLFVGIPIDHNYRKECNNLGINIIELPARKPTTFKYYFNMFKNIRKNYYDIIHINGNSSAMAIELIIAKFKKINFKIAHCHTNYSNPKVNNIFKFFFKNNYDLGLACSLNAGKWVFNKEFLILPNGFVVNKFLYNSNIRKKIRNNLNIEDKIVLGHTGRLNSYKNQKFLIELLKKLNTEDNNYVLLLVGDGPDYNKLKEQIKLNNLEDKIILYGESSNISKIYSAMDIFVFPSKCEGLGISLLEAQINGLNCIASTNVPLEADITGNVNFISLSEENEWIKSIKKINRRNKININSKKIQKFNIKNNAIFLEEIYSRKIGSRKDKL